MKIIKAIENEKYNNAIRFIRYDGAIFEGLNEWNETAFFVTIYSELEDNENTQYPLDDIMDDYRVTCRCVEEKEVDNKKILIFEAESEEIENIRLLIQLVGKRVYNSYNGDFRELIIE